MAELDNELKEVSIRIKLVEGGMFGNVQINEPQDAIRAMKNLLSDLDREMRNEMFPLNNEVNKVWDTLVPMIQEQEVRKNVRTR